MYCSQILKTKHTHTYTIEDSDHKGKKKNNSNDADLLSGTILGKPVNPESCIPGKHC